VRSCTCQRPRKKNNWEQGVMTALRRESSQRVRPACPHFGLHAGACGGCKMQHLHPAAQVAVKQRVLEDNLWHLAKVKPEMMLRPIEGPAWGYRYRAAVGALRGQEGHGAGGLPRAQVALRGRHAGVPVLPPTPSARMLMPLRELIGAMDQRDRLPQIELAAATGHALVLRHLEPLSEPDLQRLREFGARMACSGGCSPRGRTACTLDDGGPNWPMRCRSSACDALQADRLHAGQCRTSTACWWPRCGRWQVQRDERVIDWFCGLGNFTCRWPRRPRAGCWASRAARRWCSAHATTRPNGLAAKTRFEARNLFDTGAADLVAQGAADAGWSTRRARAPSRWPRRWPNCMPQPLRRAG
jgi:23S rRNA (uracil1939-C5)-methyltransferase